MNDKEVDDIIERAAGVAPEVDPVLLGRVSAAMTASLRPVVPMVAPALLAVQLLAISVVLAVAAAWMLGFYGIQKMDVAKMGSIFPALLIFTWLAALLSVAETTPGGLRWKNPEIMEPLMRNRGMLLLVMMAIWIALAAMFFRNYELDAFVPQGVNCLRAGLLIAAPTGAAAWLMLRRGFAVSPAGAGIAAGTLAGLSGLIMLEIHCPNFRAPHIMVWHTAVVPVSAITGAILAKIGS